MELLKNEGPSTYGILGIVNGSCTILLTKIRTKQSRTELKVNIVWTFRSLYWIFTFMLKGLSETTTAGKLSRYNCLLASGQGVQLIHVYNIDREFDVIETRALLLSSRYA